MAATVTCKLMLRYGKPAATGTFRILLHATPLILNFLNDDTLNCSTSLCTGSIFVYVGNIITNYLFMPLIHVIHLLLLKNQQLIRNELQIKYLG